MKTRVIYWGAFLLCLGYYFGVGAFPIGHFKQDGTSMASGALQIIQHGWDGPRIDYGRETRPGIFWTLITLRQMTGADPYLLFSLLTLAAGVGYVIFTAFFTARFVHIPAPLCGIAILLFFPNSSIWGCYPNGTAVAGCLGIIAVYLLARTDEPGLATLFIAGAIAGLSILARVDSFLMGLVCIPVLYTTDGRKMLKRMAIFLGTGIAVSLAGLLASGCNIFWILHQTQTVLSKTSASESAQNIVMKLATNECFISVLTSFPLLTVFLIILGTGRLFRRRQWNILWIVIAGILPVFLVYRTSIYSSPLYYTIPLFALLCLSTLEGIPESSRKAKLCLGVTAALLFAAQYLIGFSVVLRAKPYFPYARPTLISLGEKTFSSGPLLSASLGIGAGGAMANTEVIRFCNGLLFHPIAFHYVKQDFLESFLVMKDYLEQHQNDQPRLFIYTSAFASYTQVNKALQDIGFSCHQKIMIEEGCSRMVWKRGDLTIVHVSQENVLDPWNRNYVLASEPPRDRIIYVTAGGRERSSVEQSGHVIKAISRKEILGSEAVCVFEVEL